MRRLGRRFRFHFGVSSSSGSLAMLSAMRRASSFVSSLAAEREKV